LKIFNFYLNNLNALFTGVIIIALLFCLYKNVLRPSILFLIAVFIFIVSDIITIENFLLGLSNKNILVIFLLMSFTFGLRSVLGNGFFENLFQKSLSPFLFRIKMMALVASFSSILNNTPVVAFMIPYVKSWADEQGYPASKFLIPLSYAAILGGMITIVGTSTSLVLNGLISQQNLPLLQFKDFFFLGSLVTIFGVGYLSVFSNKLLPSNLGKKETLIDQVHDYLVETIVDKNSTLIGKTIEEAGLRHLRELFLVEIRRGKRLISAVEPNRLIQSEDRLFFAGNTKAILRLINEENGLKLVENSHVIKNRFFELTEAIIPNGSFLVGQSLKSSNFRDHFKGSVISIYRKREKVAGNLGEIELMPGDLLLLLTNDSEVLNSKWKDLILLKKNGQIDTKVNHKTKVVALFAILILIFGIVGAIDLFLAAIVGTLMMSYFSSINFIKNALDFDLLAILISALAIGMAMNSSGAAEIIANQVIKLSENSAAWVGLSILFICTLVLTSLITNVAAVSLMFPIALEMAYVLHQVPTPYFVAIAFAASADFITPIGYQTNLMVLGPGNYKFRDYFKIGFPLTLIYTLISISFIFNYYNL
jgi:di/tricarboxylate transporter